MKGFGVAADGDAGLGLRWNFHRARGDAVGTGAVPLRQATAGCGTQNMDADQPELSRYLGPSDQTAPA